jgi:hypothetical protein
MLNHADDMRFTSLRIGNFIDALRSRVYYAGQCVMALERMVRQIS